MSKSSNNLEQNITYPIGFPKSPSQKQWSVDRHSETGTPDTNIPVFKLDQQVDTQENKTMEFRRVAQELSERIQLLTCENSTLGIQSTNSEMDDITRKKSFQEASYLKNEDLKDKESRTLDDYSEKDCDILEQYSCDYSCLDLEVSSPKIDYFSNDVNKINGDSFPYFDDGDIQDEFHSFCFKGNNYYSPAKNLKPKLEDVTNDSDSNIPNSEDHQTKKTSSSPPPSDNNSPVGNSPEHSETVIQCQHPKCKEKALIHIAQRTFKTCHYCYTVYCSRQCRKMHWEKHRRHCMFGRVTSMCENTVEKVKSDVKSQFELSRYARTGYLTKGRGVLKLVFSYPDLACHFIDRGWSAILESPIYVAWQDVLPQEMGADAYVEVRNLCNRYNPETKYILIVAIYVTTQIGSIGLKKTPAAGYEREVLMKCSKMRLIPNTVLNIWQPHHSKPSRYGNSSSPFDAKDLLKSYNS